MQLQPFLLGIPKSETTIYPLLWIDGPDPPMIWRLRSFRDFDDHYFMNFELSSRCSPKPELRNAEILEPPKSTVHAPPDLMAQITSEFQISRVHWTLTSDFPIVIIAMVLGLPLVLWDGGSWFFREMLFRDFSPVFTFVLSVPKTSMAFGYSPLVTLDPKVGVISWFQDFTYQGIECSLLCSSNSRFSISRKRQINGSWSFSIQRLRSSHVFAIRELLPLCSLTFTL